MVHLYCGNGKGKSTAAMGAAIRAAGEGMRVLAVQFFKDGSSGEIKILEKLDDVTVLCEKEHFGLYKRLTEERKAVAAEKYRRLFLEAVQLASNYDLIILDEAVSACNYGIIDLRQLLELLGQYAKNPSAELILTGREPAPELCELADYVTEMEKKKHPYDTGVMARRGIEW